MVVRRLVVSECARLFFPAPALTRAQSDDDDEDDNHQDRETGATETSTDDGEQLAWKRQRFFQRQRNHSTLAPGQIQVTHSVRLSAPREAKANKISSFSN